MAIWKITVFWVWKKGLIFFIYVWKSEPNAIRAAERKPVLKFNHGGTFIKNPPDKSRSRAESKYHTALHVIEACTNPRSPLCRSCTDVPFYDSFLTVFYSLCFGIWLSQRNVTRWYINALIFHLFQAANLLIGDWSDALSTKNHEINKPRYYHDRNEEQKSDLWLNIKAQERKYGNIQIEIM